MGTEQIFQRFNETQIDAEWAFAEYKPSETGKWTHDYHRYPAKFIPQLVEKLIGEYITDTHAHINDPFMGSGTTIVTAISKGFQASGTDINKISYLVTKVKSKPIEPIYLEKKVSQFLSKLSFLDPSENILYDTSIKPIIPEKHIEKIDYWFSTEHKNQLGTILTVISREQDETIREFFGVAFSNILKNCSVWLKSSTKPTRDLKKKPANPYSAIRRHLMKMQRGNEQFYNAVPYPDKCEKYLNIQVGDAKEQPVDNNSVDLIVSSSPYVTSYEYADLHQLSTIWLDLTNDLNEYKKEFIGTSRNNIRINN